MADSLDPFYRDTSHIGKRNMKLRMILAEEKAAIIYCALEKMSRDEHSQEDTEDLEWLMEQIEDVATRLDWNYNEWLGLPACFRCGNYHNIVPESLIRRSSVSQVRPVCRSCMESAAQVIEALLKTENSKRTKGTQ